MKHKLTSLIFAWLTLHSFAQDILVESGKVLPGTSKALQSARSAACAPATGLRDLEWNNIKALIETGGSMWQDRANGRSHYYAPKNGDVSILFAGALWMGGLSPDQQLKLAAIQYRYSGNDYWPGPLSNDGTAETNETTCINYDKFSISYRTDAQKHRQYHECLLDSDCDMEELFPNGYTMPNYFNDYPAHGILTQGHDYNLAPYFDFNNNDSYDPENGDYPWFDFEREIDCAQRRREDVVPLFGDQNYYWIFNDKGNIHSESGGQPIGMEIRAQAFAFNTNDEINNMTFYNYVLINQGTQTLQDTYFGTWIDLDIGGHVDDYVGCDVQRGLGYGYNGYAFDAPSSLSLGYGENPPAVGVDFFEGPYQDADNKDNPLTSDINLAIAEDGIPYKGIGIGYGDGIIDNERFGMRKFLYHISGSGNNGVPETPVQYYNYLRGFWKNGTRMGYGGNALTTSSGANMAIAADYMFPGDTDPLHFGTYGIANDPWTEVSSGNPPSDRRFMQSAGPFTLLPGDFNNITVGVVFARAASSDPFASVELVRQADDKAQALFDNCFELISGPDAPEVSIQELENEIILFLKNENNLSSNYQESYLLFDPTIPESLNDSTFLNATDRSYAFQGYLIYQLANADVSSSDLEDPELARLIHQCDVEDDVSTIINYYKDPEIDQVVPKLMVQGANRGVQHSFRITEDAFALSNKRLVNHKTYYFMAIAYGYNNYKPYDQMLKTGQSLPFIASRKAVIGSVPIISGIPHAIAPESGGSSAQVTYGYELPLTQTEGSGNGDMALAVSDDTHRTIALQNRLLDMPYTSGSSPVKVMVIDPLRLTASDFEMSLATNNQNLQSDSASWQIKNLTTDELFNSAHAIHSAFEEIITHWGISVSWKQQAIPTEAFSHYTAPILSELVFADASKQWLAGIPDDDSNTPFNWIRSGSNYIDVDQNNDPLGIIYNDYFDGATTNSTIQGTFPSDPNESYEALLSGTWAPYCLTGGTVQDENMGWVNAAAPTTNLLAGDNSPLLYNNAANLIALNNVQIILTNNTELWTRCPVLEMQPVNILSEGGADKMQMRQHPSVDKAGRAINDPNCNMDEATLMGTQPNGMGWFPGYAIDLGTGERLNMAFGEDSGLPDQNGRDMLWNPTSQYFSNIGEQIYFGGQHWIYIFKNLSKEIQDDSYMPSYDQGQFYYSKADNGGVISVAQQRKLLAACTWVGSAMASASYEQIRPGSFPCDVSIRLCVEKPYIKFDLEATDLDNEAGSQNHWNPVYRFSTKNIQTQTNQQDILTSALDIINVVPNPYYAFSSYESNKLDNRIKITNLPQECAVRIYDLNGTQVRAFKKGDPTTYLDWDLKNEKNIPIASGVYIIHVEVTGIGQKVLKWFGVMRPVDLDNF
jgi:hypothetical protein